MKIKIKINTDIYVYIPPLERPFQGYSMCGLGAVCAVLVSMYCQKLNTRVCIAKSSEIGFGLRFEGSCVAGSGVGARMWSKSIFRRNPSAVVPRVQEKAHPPRTPLGP